MNVGAYHDYSGRSNIKSGDHVVIKKGSIEINLTVMVTGNGKIKAKTNDGHEYSFPYEEVVFWVSNEVDEVDNNFIKELEAL